MQGSTRQIIVKASSHMLMMFSKNKMRDNPHLEKYKSKIRDWLKERDNILDMDITMLHMEDININCR